MTEPKATILYRSQRGGRLSRSSVYHILDHLLEVAGGENLRHNLHALRHAFAQDAMEAGADINQVSQLMNHSSVYTTSKYYGRFAQKALKQIHVKFSPGAALAVVHCL
jgi:site-specific recombinase XerD